MVRQRDLLDSVINEIKWSKRNSINENMRDVEIEINYFNAAVSKDEYIPIKMILRECCRVNYDIPQKFFAEALWSQLDIFHTEIEL